MHSIAPLGGADLILLLVALGAVALLAWLLLARRRLRALVTAREQQEFEEEMRNVATSLKPLGDAPHRGRAKRRPISPTGDDPKR
jgi:hypothetical protein